MIQSPNYIHFRNQWQILGLDSYGQWPDRQAFQDLLNKLNDSSINADFDDFSYKGNLCEMGKPRGDGPEGGQAFSKLACTSNQITIVEEWAEISSKEYIDKFVKILEAWFSIFPNTTIIAQKCCLRALVQPAIVNDSRNFLGDRILNIGPSMKDTFNSMPFKVGFSFTCLHKSRGYTLIIDTKVNSWRDNKTVWVQVEGTSPLEKPINATNTDSVKYPFEDCIGFFESEVIGFLNKYDSND